MSMTKPIALCKFHIAIHNFSNHPLSPFHLIPFLFINASFNDNASWPYIRNF